MCSLLETPQYGTSHVREKRSFNVNLWDTITSCKRVIRYHPALRSFTPFHSRGCTAVLTHHKPIKNPYTRTVRLQLIGTHTAVPVSTIRGYLVHITLVNGFCMVNRDNFRLGITSILHVSAFYFLLWFTDRILACIRKSRTGGKVM